MAYVNVADWETGQVCEWLKGLDNTVFPYVHSFLNHAINGQQLLSLQPNDLEQLGVLKLGHQEIILEAVEYLRSLHYELDTENLQLLALRISSQAHSLYKQLCRQTDSKPVTTQTLSDVASLMMAVKPLVRWMDRPPFNGEISYHEKKAELMKISLEMATCAQRDRFAEKPIEEIRTTCNQLAQLADYIIQDITDPMILQPASLDLATLKKKSNDDLGFCILPSFYGVHQITEIKLGSAAHLSGKMEEGDEIVQVNYQTVVGWERKNLLELFRESPAEILLTVKRRPRHTNIYGQIYIKPFRLPSNKSTSSTIRHNLPPPRPELLTTPDYSLSGIPKKPSPESTSILDAIKMLDTMTIDSSDSDCEAESQFYPTKPRNLVQRRATITGASPTTKHDINIEQFWKELKQEHRATLQLRDKAASCAHGLDDVPTVNIRPQTCLGLETAIKRKKTDEQTNKKVQFNEKLTDTKTIRADDTKEKVIFIQNCDDDNANVISKNINIEHLDTSMDNVIDSNNLSDTIVPLHEYNSTNDTCNINENISKNKEINMRYVKKHDKLNENCSVSAYNLSDTEEVNLIDYSLNNVPNNNLTKTDVCTIIENINDFKKLKNANGKHKKISVEKCNGNVAQKISNIEKQIAHEKTEEQTSIIGQYKKTDLHKDNRGIINGESIKNSTEEKNQNDHENDISVINDIKHAVEKLIIQCENVISNYPGTLCLNNSICEYPENTDCNNSEISNSKWKCSNNNSSNSSNSNNSGGGRNGDDSSNGGSSRSGGSNNSTNSSNCSGSSSTRNSSSNNNSNNNSNSSSNNKNNSDYADSSSNNNISNSNNIEKDEVQKFDKILPTVDCTLTQHAPLLEKTSSSVLSRENFSEMKTSPNNNTKSIKDNLPNIIHNVSNIQIDTKQQTEEIKSADLPSAQAITQPCRYIELPKIESIKKFENKSHITLPEPPPRKYYTKQAITDLKLNNVSQSLEDLEKPQVPERLGIKQECKKVDLSSNINHIKSNLDCQNRKDSSDVPMVNYTENSMDFIGELQTISLNDQKFDRLNLSNASLYNENNDKQSREEKCSFEKYEKFVEKFVCSDQSITDCYRFDHSPHNIECPDGITYSKQIISSDLKPRLSEKDKSFEKSVVNRAMMVARSIGLHGSLNKSNSSPRSNRRRNMLLAKKRTVSVRDVGTGDLEGWLTYRSRGAGGAWAKAWFVLKDSSLYRFKTHDSTKADCLIVLTGFTVSPATEIKSRKHSFKVYHTGTVFYFATDTEDCLILWLDAVSKGTLGADAHNQSIGFFSETDESDSENQKSKLKYTPESSKSNVEKSLGLKKTVRKDVESFKDHEIGGASLDRKYLKFLSARNQNIPVPTAQFRSYRRVLPMSIPNKKENYNSNSPDVQMTIAGSTFYGLNISQNATDISNNPDMSDYRYTIDSHNKRPDNLQSFITQEYMTSQQDEELQNTTNRSPRATPSLNDHVHKNLNDNATYSEQIKQLSNTISNDVDNIYSKTGDKMPNNITYAISKNTSAHMHMPREFSKDNFASIGSENEGNCINDKSYDRYLTAGRQKKDSSISQKRRIQKFMNVQEPRHSDSFHRKNVINPNEQNSPNQSAEHNIHIQFSNHENYKMHDCLSSRNIEAGSPRLHRMLFRDKCCLNQSQHRLSTRSSSQSPDSGEIRQSHSFVNSSSPQMLNQTFDSVNDLNPDTSTSFNISKHGTGYSSNYKNSPNSNRNLTPPIFPYIPPPTSPPPDYTSLEYPPIFEPGTYSLSDASLLRNRNKNSHNAGQ
ncbi:hypothetical protein P5V15_013287 [Pogonomyrmex californicus]